MIPGLTSDGEARLAALLDPQTTDATAAFYASRPFMMLSGFDPDTVALGITATGPAEPMVVVTDPGRPVGRVHIRTEGRDALLVIDNAGGGTIEADIRVLGDDAAIVLNRVEKGHVGLRTAFLRSHRQMLFWGLQATAVELSVEIEGADQAVAIGDDALIAGETWIRNHDMHAMHDLSSGRLLSRPAVTTVLERHVWLGQGAMLLGCERVGAGSIVGARALLRAPLPGCVVAAGTPARVLREGVSWGRDLHGMSGAERAALGYGESAPVC